MNDEERKAIKVAWANGVPIEHSVDGVDFKPWLSDVHIDLVGRFWRIKKPTQKFRVYEITNGAEGICGKCRIIYWNSDSAEPTLSKGQRWLTGWINYEPCSTYSEQ